MVNTVSKIPSSNLPLTDGDGRIHPIWYEYLRSFISSVGEASTGTTADNTVIAGSGIEGTGAVSTVNVGAGDGIIVNANDVAVDIIHQINAAASPEDELLISDASDLNAMKKTSIQSVLDLVPTPPTAVFTLLDTQTASSSASLDFDISGNYSSVLFVLEDLKPATDNVRLYVRTSADAITYDSGASNYAYNFYGLQVTGASLSGTGSAGATEIHTTSGIGNASNELLNGRMLLIGPTTSNYKMMEGTILGVGATGVPQIYHFGGFRLSAAAVLGVQFFFASGNIASGTIYAYGISNT